MVQAFTQAEETIVLISFTGCFTLTRLAYIIIIHQSQFVFLFVDIVQKS